MKNKTLKIRAFHINEIELGQNFNLTTDCLSISDQISFDSEIFDNVFIQIIKPHQHDIETNTIMDIIPISTKVLGHIGEGLTHTLTGVFVLLTGRIKNGEQLHEFGSSEGILSQQLKLNKPGTPGENDLLIHIDCMMQENLVLDRVTCNEAFQLADQYIQKIREKMKLLEASSATETHLYEHKTQPDKPNVILVKQLPAQGAMYDAMLFSDEPSGFSGGQSIIDLHSMPVYLTVNEYRDGAIRALS
ncbi:proline reductase cluster protein PrdD [Vagococcus zengguangii]|uniref:Proline reductase cluster protein PrdD n=1 Tax=Vagococcus zengguangii TaxID=2571750 RepID=A0A4D7CVZ1_9ENTE|nr:proline reductase cluster protein PrdD [Vagococcus zengguangii]QCI86437.1 proline reductase cluster protein PrdD [Vagococcus zengguangii]